MARKQLKIVSVGTPLAERKYSCSNCPARCCKNWGIRVTSEEAERIARDPKAVSRLSGRGPEILAQGQLPMRQEGDDLVCVFLDEDQLCSLHKRHGPAFLPQACQAFPFAFQAGESGVPLPLLSRYCPSIAKNEGEPIEPTISSRLQLLGASGTLSPKMGLRSGRVLERKHYLQLIDALRPRLENTSHLAQTLVHLFFITEATDQNLPADHNPNDAEFQTILKEALKQEPPTLKRRPPSWGARILISHLLGAICSPLRGMQPFRQKAITLGERFVSLGVRLKWLLRIGRVRLLFLKAPVSLAAIERVPPFLASERASDLGRFLSEVLARRQGMNKQTYLHRFIIELALMSIVASRYARALAASQSAPRVESDHLREGIGIAELMLSHQGQLGQSLVLDQLRLKLMSNPDEFINLLSSEI